MDLKQIEKLIAAMERSSLKRIVLKQEGFEIELERESAHEMVMMPAAPPQTEMRYEAPSALAPRETKQAQAPAAGSFVTSPMVGTYYASPSPDDPPFVKVGDFVEENTVLCIIEAMKVMNEVKAGMKGRIVEVLLKNGNPVEFGTPIYRIES